MAGYFQRNSATTTRGVSGILTRLVLLFLGLYRAWSRLGVFRVFVPTAGYACRFSQSCSLFAFESIHRDGVWVGGRAAINRLTQCHPWGPLHINTL